MISIKNRMFDPHLIGTDDIFIGAMGYETRSFYLWNNFFSKRHSGNDYIFVFDDYHKHNEQTRELVNKIRNEEMAQIIDASYDSSAFVREQIKKIITTKQNASEALVLHIDYSSMPRTWYFGLPFFLESCLRENDRLNFWYVAGTYPVDYENSFDAGINSFRTFGYPSLHTEKRQHVLSLSYDKVRTGAILSILDPDVFVACNAYDPKHKEVSENVKRLNGNIVAQARMLVSLRIDDFEFMISKLSEIVLEFIGEGDVVFVPDGPKPLIFAMSLIPDYLGRRGVSCLQITRNDLLYTPVNVAPTDTIFGVEFTRKCEGQYNVQ